MTRKQAIATIDAITFEGMWDDILERVSNGEPLTQIARDDPRNPDIPRLRRWILNDPTRRNAYYEARKTGAEAVEDEMIAIADATDNPLEDIQRSKLRLDTRKFLLSVWNKSRYGEKQETVNGTFGSGGIVIQIGNVEVPTGHTIDHE